MRRMRAVSEAPCRQSLGLTPSPSGTRAAVLERRWASSKQELPWLISVTCAALGTVVSGVLGSLCAAMRTWEKQLLLNACPLGEVSCSHGLAVNGISNTAQHLMQACCSLQSEAQALGA